MPIFQIGKPGSEMNSITRVSQLESWASGWLGSAPRHQALLGKAAKARARSLRRLIYTSSPEAQKHVCSKPWVPRPPKSHLQHKDRGVGCTPKSYRCMFYNQVQSKGSPAKPGVQRGCLHLEGPW